MDVSNNLLSEDSLSTLELYHIKKQFLCCTPVNEIMMNVFIQKLLNESESLTYQKELLENTVNHPLMEKFGLKLTYQQTFIKLIINKLESNGKEVLDELYSTYCELLNICSEDMDYHYRHFILDFHGMDYITVKESNKVISQGTTGLCSWQASLALADWCLQNEQYFHDKHVLELGSGVGLTGLVVTLCCHPSSYLFSDCHPSVLEMLQSNIVLNTSRENSKTTDNLNNDLNKDSKPSDYDTVGSNIKKKQMNLCCTSRDIYRTIFNDTEIGILDLPWESIPDDKETLLNSPDVVLAADVVFDCRLFKDLCQAFSHLLQKKSCCVLLACTVRNEDTLDSFLEMLKSEELEVCEEQLLAPKYILYSNSVPIKLYRILSK